MATNVRFFKIKHFDNYETDFKDKSISDIVGNNNFYEEAFYLNSNDGSLYLGNQKLSNAQEVQQLIENFEQLYDFQREITTTNTDGTITTETIDYSDIDKGKAIRTIAIEELSYQLLSDKAEADFKTLQELGAWIEDHPESVAEMNLAIQNNAKDIDDIQLDIMRLDVQPDWELDNDQSHAYIKDKPPIKKGAKSTSITIGDSIANGEYSLAEGFNTIAEGYASHVQGQYNIKDNENKYAHIVGGGIDDLNRKNIHTVDWNGNAWYAGDVYIGGFLQNDSKKLATEEYVDNVKDSIALKDASTGQIYNIRINNGTLEMILIEEVE